VEEEKTTKLCAPLVLAAGAKARDDILVFYEGKETSEKGE
jgi:hypothetical protein